MRKDLSRPARLWRTRRPGKKASGHPARWKRACRESARPVMCVPVRSNAAPPPSAKAGWRLPACTPQWLSLRDRKIRLTDRLLLGGNRGFRPFCLEAQLAAGRVNVVALLASQSRDGTVVAKDLKERFLAIARRT